MAEIDLTPTEEMAANAARGLDLRRKHGKGGTEIGVARARDISNRKNLSPETVRRMHAFFSRHEKNKAGGEDDAGYIAWLLWGGDSGQSWAKRKVEQMDKGENQRSDTYKEIAQRLGSAAKMAYGVADAAPKFTKGETVADAVHPNRKGKVVEVIPGSYDAKSYTKAENQYIVSFMPKGGLVRYGEQRLVRASRPGAKAGTGTAAMIERLENELQELGYRPSTDPRAAERMNAIRRELSLLKQATRASRPGAKAKMGRAEKVMRDGSVHLDFTAAKEWLSAAKDAELRYIVADSKSALNANPDGKKFNYYRDLVLEAMKELKKRGFSRPGAKAKFGMTNAGYKALVDAIRVYGDSAPAAVVAQAKQMKQEPTEFTDNEVMAVIAKMKQARASRPGAKVKMAANEVDLWNYLSKSDVVLARQNATDLATLKRYAQMALTKPDFTPPSRAQHGPSMHAMAKDTLADIRAWEESVRRHRNRMSRPGAKVKMASAKTKQEAREIANNLTIEFQIPAWAEDGVVYVNSTNFNRAVEARKKQSLQGYNSKIKVVPTPMSRPGAKAKMAESLQAMWDGKQWKVTTPSGAAWYSEDGKRWTKKHGEPVTPAEVRQYAIKLGTGFSRHGAKVANAVREGEKVSASDTAVSRKIRKLMDEGKPQKQAVAIALDLERRGEL